MRDVFRFLMPHLTEGGGVVFEDCRQSRSSKAAWGEPLLSHPTALKLLRHLHSRAVSRRERPAADYRESLAACQRAAWCMRRLTESLLTLARLDSGEAAATREPCDLDRVIRDVADFLISLAQEQGVALEVESTPTRCQGNAEALGQVVINLVSNAIYYNRPAAGCR